LILKSLTVTFVVVFLAVLPAAYAQAHTPAAINDKPVYEVDVMPVVESTLSRMWDVADAVVDVQIESSVVKSISRPDSGGRPRIPHIRTFHTSKVLRVIKGDFRASTIVFSQSAGQLELSDKIIRIADSEPLAAGARYVVFLRRNENSGPWTLVGERDGAFKLENGRLKPQGFGIVAKEQSNITERQFRDELDRVARTRQAY
jgi:hypothetical protein